MVTYYWTFAVVFACSLMASSISKTMGCQNMTLKAQPFPVKIFLFLTAAMLIFVAGCRYYVGTDYGAYYKGLKIYAPRLKTALQEFDEPGLPLVATIVSWFTDDGAYLVFACSLLTIGLFLTTIYRNENSFLMVSLLFMFLPWNGTFNGVRQYFAAAVLFVGHRFIYEKKLWKWLLTVFLAACFHITALVMVILYFLLRNKVSIRNVILLTIGTYIVSANYDAIFSLIGFLKDTDATNTTVYATTSVNTLRILVACAPAIVCLVLYSNKNLTKEQTFYMNSLVIHAAAMVAASNSAYLARIGIYTTPFVVVALPKLFRTENKVLERILRIGIVVLYAIFFYVEISGSKSLNPFHWIWERNVI